jgi:type 1 glutamine amidotransferase
VAAVARDRAGFPSVKKLGLALATGWVAFTTGPLALAAPTEVDCPLAHEPYSSRTPLLDLLIDPSARTVLERVAPSLLKPPFGGDQWPTQPPTFAAILTPEAMSKTFPLGPTSLTELDAGLAEVAVTDEATRRRCARYDTQPPSLPGDLHRPAILVFDKINGFRDAPSVDAGSRALKAIAARRGWSLVFSDNGAVFNTRDLARFDAVVWNNVSGDALTLSQRAAFRSWIEQGGGFAGMHGSGGDPVYFWDWYADTLIGARFKGHPMSPQFQQARVVVEDRSSAITAGLGDGWAMTEEWYSFEKSPREKGVHVLASLDEATYLPVGMNGADLRMVDHPIAWMKCIGDGRSFYTAIGHRPESYTEPHSAALLEHGIEWAAGRGKSHCEAGREVRK